MIRTSRSEPITTMAGSGASPAILPALVRLAGAFNEKRCKAVIAETPAPVLLALGQHILRVGCLSPQARMLVLRACQAAGLQDPPDRPDAIARTIGKARREAELLRGEQAVRYQPRPSRVDLVEADHE